MKKNPPNSDNGNGNGTGQGDGPEETKLVNGDWVLIRTNAGCLEKILLGDILYIMAEQNYSYVITENEKHCVSKPLGKMLEDLSPYGFLQVHKSYLINMANFKNIQGDFVIVKTIKVPLGAHYKPALLNAFPIKI